MFAASFVSLWQKACDVEAVTHLPGATALIAPVCSSPLRSPPAPVALFLMHSGDRLTTEKQCDTERQTHAARERERERAVLFVDSQPKQSRERAGWGGAHQCCKCVLVFVSDINQNLRQAVWHAISIIIKHCMYLHFTLFYFLYLIHMFPEEPHF